MQVDLTFIYISMEELNVSFSVSSTVELSIVRPLHRKFGDVEDL